MTNASQKAKLDRLETSLRRNRGAPGGEESEAEGEPCFKCGKPGHRVKDCPDKDKNKNKKKGE